MRQQEDLTLDGLPGGALDELRLRDVRLGCKETVTFSLTNRSEGKTFRCVGWTTRLCVLKAAKTRTAQAQRNQLGLSPTQSTPTPRHRRFKWPDHPTLKFSPAVGHLHPNASKRITATFHSAAPLRLDGQELKLQVAQIQCKGPAADWDDLIAAAAAAAAASSAPQPPAHAAAHGTPQHAARGGGAGGRGGAKGAAAAAHPGGEPLHDVVPKTQRDMVVKVGLGMGAWDGFRNASQLAASEHSGT